MSTSSHPEHEILGESIYFERNSKSLLSRVARLEVADLSLQSKVMMNLCDALSELLYRVRSYQLRINAVSRDLLVCRRESRESCDCSETDCDKCRTSERIDGERSWNFFFSLTGLREMTRVLHAGTSRLESGTNLAQKLSTYPIFLFRFFGGYSSLRCNEDPFQHTH